jgi:rod shape determining protein RodA
MSRYVSFRDFDWLLLAFVLLICGFGVMEIYSATLHTKFAGAHIKQIYWITAGLAMMFLVSMVNYQMLLENVHWMYVGGVGSLLIVMAFGQKYLGARRWIKLPGGQHFQPSEWVKLILILALAKYFSDMRQRDPSWSDIIKAGALVAIPMLMVLAQPDLGTTLRFRHGLIIVSLAALMMPVAWHVLKPYQRERLTSFMRPEADRQGSGYQVIQSQIAVGAGGLFGKGTAQGTQTRLAFLPVPQTDFIFAAFSEEHGFVGALSLLLLYFMVLMRLIHNAQTAPDRAGTFVVMGVVAVIAFHVLINVGMVVGFMPVTGIPLPLMSYGGSSVLFTFLALGMVMNIRMRRFVN